MVRFLYFFISQENSGHTQSLVIAATLTVTSVIMFAVGILADLMAANRVLLQDVRARLLKQEIERGLNTASGTARNGTISSPQQAAEVHARRQSSPSRNSSEASSPQTTVVAA